MESASTPAKSSFKNEKFFLCLTGLEKHTIEKDLIKFFRKAFGQKQDEPAKETEANAEEEAKEGPLKANGEVEPEEIELPLSGVAKKRGTSYGFLQFKDYAQRKQFEEQFAFAVAPRKHYRLKEVNKKVDFKSFKPIRTKSEMQQDADNRKQKIQSEITKADVDEVLADSIEKRVTPLAHLSYDEQLKAKHADLRSILDSFSTTLLKEIQRNNEIAPTWFKALKETDYRLPFDEEIIAEPEQIEQYRNKVEFTVGRMYAPPGDGEDQTKLWSDKGPLCVGFNRNNAAKGINFVDKPDDIKVNSAESLIVAKKFEQIVIKSGLLPFNKASNSGFWRILLYRESKVTKQVLVSIVVTEGEELPERVQQEIVQEFSAGTLVGERGFKIVSLSIIRTKDISGGYKEGDDIQVLSGDIHYSEELCELNFNVSPFAFFQVNTRVFEKMLAQISQFAEIDENTTLFDICCGTGAIGLCLSAKAKKVIGVDIIEQAIENAKQNIKLNAAKLDGEKIEFHAGKAEEVMPPIVLRESGANKIVGIVDPPRSGLHRDVLKALRTCKGLDRLVYVSCNAHSQMRDLQYLCYETKAKRKAPCFKVVKAVGADLFPHTSHIESIVLLERSYE